MSYFSADIKPLSAATGCNLTNQKPGLVLNVKVGGHACGGELKLDDP